MRHGLSRMALGDAASLGRINQIANTLCGKDPFPYRYNVALEIAEAQVMLDRIRLARAHIIATTTAPSGETRPQGTTTISDEKFRALLVAMRKRQVRRVRQLVRAPALGFATNIDALAKGARPSPPIFPPEPPKPLTGKQQQLKDFCDTLPMLVSLERYERAALARKRRAIRKFDALRDD